MMSDKMFNVTCNEMDCIAVLQSLYNLLDWNQLRPYLEKKIEEVYEAIATYLISLVESCHSYRLQHFPYMPKYSSICITASAMSHVVEKLKLVSVNINHIISYYGTASDLCMCYVSVAISNLI